MLQVRGSRLREAPVLDGPMMCTLLGHPRVQHPLTPHSTILPRLLPMQSCNSFGFSHHSDVQKCPGGGPPGFSQSPLGFSSLCSPELMWDPESLTKNGGQVPLRKSLTAKPQIQVMSRPPSLPQSDLSHSLVLVC